MSDGILKYYLGIKQADRIDTTSIHALSPKVLYDRIAELEAIVAAQGINLSKKSKCIAELQAQLDAVRGYIQQNDDWDATTKETVRNIKQALSGEDTSAPEDTCTCCFCISVKALNGEEDE